MDTLTFHQALLQAEAQARSTLTPELCERLSAAVALVKAGKVFQTSAGLWQVDSSSTQGLTYTVNGTCACEDHHYNHPPQGLCKHRLSMFLAQRTMTLMRQPPAPVVPEMVEPFPDNDPEDVPASPTVETEPVPASPPLPEAPASCNVSVTIGGHKVQVTLRDSDEHRMLDRLAVVLQQFPVPPPASPQAPTQGQGEGNTPQCPTHGALSRSTKGKGWYCPRQNEDGSWCKSKGR